MFSIAYRRGDFEVTLSAYTIEGVLALDDAYNAEDDDGWITWNGGKCPVADYTRVTVLFRDGEKYDGCVRSFRWRHRGDADDIIAYKVVKNA